MLLVIVGAGASFDSVPSRPPRTNNVRLEELRPPLADELFEPREHFEAIQRQIPQVMQIAPSLLRRPSGASVEDVLAEYAGEADRYPQRATQLTAVKFYLQAIIANCDTTWCLNNPVATNMMSLIDRIELFRGDGDRPVFVTFNYDRLIENALINRGQRYADLQDYIPSTGIPLIKLHGSVDWARRLGFSNPLISKSGWPAAAEIANNIKRFREPGVIERAGTIPTSHVSGSAAIPAIAIPVKEKSSFECPSSHVDFLRARIKDVKTILTIGWRGSERHFLKLLKDSGLKKFDAMCVGGALNAGEETIQNLQLLGIPFDAAVYNQGFTGFLAERRADPILAKTWH